jgi:hypothetical protein
MTKRGRKKIFADNRIITFRVEKDFFLFLHKQDIKISTVLRDLLEDKFGALYNESKKVS